ncbi:MAG: CHASE2 domain-containing protein, partial [Cyanobacteria bacterium]|nr:CHASE2 domain-containing protein [Cyanobacteriota bacterium]
MVRPLKLRSGDKETPKQQILAVVLSFLFGAMVFVFIQLFNLDKFIEELELKTFDMRVFIQQGSNANKPSKDIVVVKFDDPTLRLFEEDFGTWPWPRGVHAS